MRSEIRTRLSEMSVASVEQSSYRICTTIAENPSLFEAATTMAVYAAHGPEVSLAQLHALLPQLEFVYPLCRPESRLTFHRVESLEELKPGMLGIPEPDPDIHPEVSLSEVQVCMCPGLAFGIDGTRLGHGGGYYDRVLSDYRGRKYGIAFQEQLKDSVPHDDHDVRVDAIISDAGLIEARPH